MRVEINLDDHLLSEATRLSGIETTEELVREALKVFITTKRRKSLLDLRGKIEFAPDYDPKLFR